MPSATVTNDQEPNITDTDVSIKTELNASDRQQSFLTYLGCRMDNFPPQKRAKLESNILKEIINLEKDEIVE